MSAQLNAQGEVAVTLSGDRLLRLPGPSPVPDRIVRAISRPMMGHRSGQFRTVFEEAVSGLKSLFLTDGDVYVLAGSGTLAMESAMINLLDAGETCIVASAGKFGERWIELAEAFGVEPIILEVPYGQAISPQDVGQALDDHPHVRVVFITQNESSTGVINDIEAVARQVRSRDGLLVVDAVSSLGGVPLPMDAWGVDVVVSGSQKCLMLPPGLSFVAASERAKSRSREIKGRGYYGDWGRYSDSFTKGETPYTPAVSLIYGLVEALAILAEEGDEARHDRHRLMRDMIRAGVSALGFTPFVSDSKYASPTVTSVQADQLDVEALRSAVRQATGVVLSGGQGSLKGNIFRIGHMGAATPLDMIATLGAIEIAMASLDQAPPVGAGTGAALEVWRSWKR